MPIKCDDCGETKSFNHFPRKWVTNEEGVKKYVPTSTCIPCVNKQGDERLKREQELHRETKEFERRAAEEKARIKAERRKKIAQFKRDYVARERSKDEAERELVRREMCRRSLLRFVERFTPNYEAGWVHHDICARLEQFFKDVQERKDPRLMLFMPPRHGKSEIASRNFPAWVLGHRPDYDIIVASYALSLSSGFSFKVRTLLASEDYRKVFPQTYLHKDRANLEGWETTKGGVFTPAGTQGAVTGKGANVLIIDDPVKDQEEADSETIREKIWDWYGTTAHSRLAPDSGVLVIQTRWHDDDLSGRLIRHMNEAATETDEFYKHLVETTDLSDEEIETQIRELSDSIERWEVVSYPALAEEDEYLSLEGDIVRGAQPEGGELLRPKGEALHPERFSRQRLLKTKRVNQKRHWSALYQQNPVPDEGLVFKKEMFRYEANVVDWRELPIGIAFDCAIGKRITNDYTVGVVGALDYEDNLHILDMVRGRWDDPYEISNLMLDLYEKYSTSTGHCVLGVERDNLEKAIYPELMRRAKARGVYPVLDRDLKPITEKTVRAKTLQGRMQAGTVYFPTSQPWLEAMQLELLRFPGGLHDDIVDALAWLARMAGKSFHKPTVRRAKPMKSWKDRLRRHIVGSRERDWRTA